MAKCKVHRLVKLELLLMEEKSVIEVITNFNVPWLSISSSSVWVEIPKEHNKMTCMSSILTEENYVNSVKFC